MQDREMEQVMRTVLLAKFPKIMGGVSSGYRTATAGKLFSELFGISRKRGCDAYRLSQVLESLGIQKTKGGRYKIPV